MKKTKSKKREKKNQKEKEIGTGLEHAIANRLREALKKDAEKEIEIPEEQFFEEPARQLPISDETKAPVLETIIQRQEQLTPIQDFVNQQREREETQERREQRIDYSPARNQPNYNVARTAKEEEEERKYESAFVPPVLARREIRVDGMREEFLRISPEAWQEREDRREEQQLQDINLIEDEIKLPFEEQQRKYKRHRLR